LLAAYLDLRGDLMARFDTSGIDDMINELGKIGELVGETADRMLLAGAEEVKKAWKKSAEMHGLRDTGDMIDSINYASTPKTAESIRQIDIYPQGKDRKGVRNAEKAFILHYGSSKIDATHWVDDADKLAAEPVQKAMETEFDKLLNGKG